MYGLSEKECLNALPLSYYYFSRGDGLNADATGKFSSLWRERKVMTGDDDGDGAREIFIFILHSL